MISLPFYVILSTCRLSLALMAIGSVKCTDRIGMAYQICIYISVYMQAV